ncbi:E3 ubiquitin-protein ligase TRIM56-like [Branchiostoma lanceolatum]|uniref:E3 ubiquitin-protein ligase TRIM56-like n=1 Tax=Branchiostoma lanceolatum TaxID=7740 RepID=UPI003451F724
MATAAFPEKVGDDSTQCTICFYTFKNPKVLPCLHTFCEHCLREWVQKNDGDTFPCPICRQLVPLPQNGVDGLKDNFFIASLVKALTEHHKVHHGKNDLACTNCEEGKPATSRCSECAEFLCESCESAHRLLRATKGHTLFTFEELKTGKYDNVFRARKAPPCPKHSGEILKLYCRTCETPICNECALFEHRDSQHDYTRIEEVAAEKRETILDLTPQCQDRMQLFRQTEEVQKRLKEQLQLNAEGACQNVHKTVQTLIALVKEEGEWLLTCIDREKTTKTKQIEAEIEGAQISLASAKSTCEFAETLAREGGDYEVVSFSQDMTTRLNDLTKPPVDTVDFELANITVEYSVLGHKLTTNSPQTAQYSLPNPAERELCSLLKSATPSQTISRTRRLLRPPRGNMYGNVNRLEHEEASRSILVSNIPEGVSRDKLEIHFMRMCNGGDEIESITMVTDTEAKITYLDEAAVERVLERPHVLNGVEVRVRKWIPPEDDAKVEAAAEKDNRSILMSSIPECVTRDKYGHPLYQKVR